MSELKITVPMVPPSVNTYVRHAKGQHYKSNAAKTFEQEMAIACRDKFVRGYRFSVSMRVYLGPRQHPDTDNLPKMVLDCLAANGVFREDGLGTPVPDSWVDRVECERFGDDRGNPRTEITVTAL